MDAPSKVKPGTTGLLKAAGNGMRYFLRVPKRYDAKNGTRLIVFLHGSNMNGLEYLRSFEAKKWCGDDILCCPNGETGIEFWRVHGESTAAKPLITGYLARRAQERTAAVNLFNESQSLFRSEKKNAAWKVLEKLRDEAPYTYQAYFACKWLSEKK